MANRRRSLVIEGIEYKSGERCIRLSLLNARLVERKGTLVPQARMDRDEALAVIDALIKVRDRLWTGEEHGRAVNETP